VSHSAPNFNTIAQCEVELLEIWQIFLTRFKAALSRKPDLGGALAELFQILEDIGKSLTLNEIVLEFR